MHRFTRLSIFMVGMCVLALACANPDHPEGLAESGGGNGPMVWFDPLAKPVPEIPFPNDLATILDDNTVTGRRINISVEAPTGVERDIRRVLNTLDGFGTYAALSVRFDSSVDLTTVTDATVMVIKLEEPMKGYAVPLDLGKGYFPILWRPDDPWWKFDPYGEANNIMMDPSNTADLDGDTAPEFVEFYELETNTLVLRQLYPLEEASRYAVVLLRSMKGANGEPVRSPFQYINHTMQTKDLEPVVGILQQRGIGLDQVAFTWSFTTESISTEWVNLWDGIYNGTGPLGDVKSSFSSNMTLTDLELPTDADGNPYTMSADWFGPLLKTVATLIGQDDYAKIADFRYVDYFVFGHFDSPAFFSSMNFGNPLFSPSIYFDQAKLAGAVPPFHQKATWMLTVPKSEDMGLDGCPTALHPQGCKDHEETGAAGVDGGFGFASIDDNSDGWVDDSGEYMWPGSDDVADPAGDNYDAALNPTGTQGNGVLDFDFGADGEPGFAGVDDDGNGIIDDTTEFRWGGSDDGLAEDANQDGRLNAPPFPVGFYGHGHGSSRIESIGFAGPMAQFGIALYGFDNFGHGPMVEFGNLDQLLYGVLEDLGVDLDELCNSPYAPGSGCESAFGILQLIGADLNGDRLINEADMDGKIVRQIIYDIFHLEFFIVLGTEGRGYDTDIPPDGIPDSGDIFWTANILQTRDLVRQTAIDWMQFVRIVDSFGTHASLYDMNGDTLPELEGDMNGDGVIDVGGNPQTVNTRGHFMFGSSLGGMMGDINMGVNPRFIAGAPVSGAGGMPDVIPRSHQRSATRPVMLQICGPIVVGDNSNGGNPVPGRVTLYWNDDPISQAFGFLYVPPNGRVQVNNLINGEVELVESDIDGNFSIGIAADVNDSIEIISLDDATSPFRSTVATHSKYKGHGIKRNSPDMRRFIALAQWAIDRGDAINIAAHYFTHARAGYLYKPWSNYPDKAFLKINTSGDSSVPINTGNSIGTVSTLWSLDQAQWLIDKGINVGWMPDSGFPEPIFDAEDLDDDNLKCGFSSNNPADPPDVRCTDDPPFPMPLTPVQGMNGPRVSAMRWPYVKDTGTHGFSLPGDQNHGIDWGIYIANMMGFFFAADGKCIIDDPWELMAAPMILPGPNGIRETASAGDDQIRTVRVMKTLGANDCNYPFPEIEVITTGPNFIIDSSVVGDDIPLTYSDMVRGP